MAQFKTRIDTPLLKGIQQRQIQRIGEGWNKKPFRYFLAAGKNLLRN